MKDLNRYTVLPILLFALIYVVGCGPTTTAPMGWLPSVFDAQHESYGGWVSVRYHTGGSEREAHGELIAINPSQIFILTGQEFTDISIDSIAHVKLTTVQLSNVANVDKYRQMMYPVKPLYEFRAYARFPQGLPEAIDVQSVKAKKKTREITHSSKFIANGGTDLRLGILGTSISGVDINGIPGGEFGIFFGKGPLIVDFNYRFFYGTHQDSKFVSGSWVIGGRYHFSNKRNISPYLGGGLTWGGTRYETVERVLRTVCLSRYGDIFGIIPSPFCKRSGKKWQDILYTYEGTGLGAYGIIGIEFRHLHQSRFNLELRIDSPFYELESGSYRSVSLGIPFSLGMYLSHQF